MTTQGKTQTNKLQWIPGHCQIAENEHADALAKRVPKLHKHILEKHPTIPLNYI